MSSYFKNTKRALQIKFSAGWNNHCRPILNKLEVSDDFFTVNVFLVAYFMFTQINNPLLEAKINKTFITPTYNTEQICIWEFHPTARSVKKE